MFEKILIANRGEIALRIHRACKELGIHTVAVHSTADSDAMHVRLADESVCIGPPAARDSYLNMAAIVSAAEITGSEAIHPGVGFLSENADFAEIVGEHHLVFIGPTPEHIRVMGDKITAKKAVQALGIPTVPGSNGILGGDEEAIAIANQIGYPVLIKAAAGGGGKGMKVANNDEELLAMLPLARSESKAFFNSDEVFLEKFLLRPRHIELQILGDGQGNVICLGERDCSMQRRHQKLLEEAPSPALNDKERNQITQIALKAMQKLNYASAGTLEFLYENGEFYFIEMNTRLQVEHPVTEYITGIDLVREQIRIASGLPLDIRQSEVKINGHSIEVRVNAENSETFLPSPGLVNHYHVPGGPGVRVDSHLYSGYRVPSNYDSMVAKLIVHGRTRNEALMRLRRALQEYVIGGIETTIPLHQKILTDNEFINGDYDIHWLERKMENGW